MRVLQVNSVCGVGSTGRIMMGLHAVLADQGHESVMAYGRGSAPATSRAVKFGTTLTVGIHAGLSRISDRQAFYSRLHTRRLAKFIVEWRPDIVHLHNVHGYYLDVETLFHRLSEACIPVVWTLHDCWAFTGHCAYFSAAGCDRWKMGCYTCPQTSRYPRSLLCDNSERNWAEKKALFTLPKNMTIVTPSRWLAELVGQSFLSGYAVEVIRNGVDTGVFRPTPSTFRAEYGVADQRVILGVASVWDERKGLKDFCELVRLLRVSDDMRQRYRVALVGLSRAQSRAVPGDVISLGSVATARELAEIYSAADVLFNPTHEDNYPAVNVEALACGTPVVTYDTGGSPECLGGPGDGYILRGNSVQEFVALLKRGGLDDLQVSRGAHDLSSEACSARYLELYADLAGV